MRVCDLQVKIVHTKDTGKVEERATYVRSATVAITIGKLKSQMGLSYHETFRFMK